MAAPGVRARSSPPSSAPLDLPAGLAAAADVLGKAAHENFPVASVVLPTRTRRGLRAIYGFARLVDDAGDLAPGDRLALLDWLEDDLERAYAGSPRHPLLRELQALLRERPLPPEPFRRLIAANRRDQTVARYPAWPDLAAYCELSANPVGELVLHLLDAVTPERVALSDAVCTGLQVAEHLQDVGEDFRRGRIYVPLDDMERFGVTETDLAAARASEQLRGLLAFEVDRARELLARGPALVASLSGRGRLAVAAYVGGGRAALAAIEGAEYEVLGPPPRASRHSRLIATRGVLREAAALSAAAEAAYRECRRVTRANASSFYYGIRLLPRHRRHALFAVYALARRIDDIADEAGPADEKLRRLAAVRGGLHTLASADGDPVLAAVADAARRFPLPLDAFGDLIDGAEMDVRGTDYATFDDLLVYCRRVAGSIGRLSLGVFGATDREAAVPRADALGVAFQLTNILRDIRDDLARGRVYLPREDLERYGCDLGAERATDGFRELIRFETRRTAAWFDHGLRLLPLLDRPSATAVAAMAGAYGRLLRRIERDPELALAGRVALPGWEKGWAAVRGLVAAAP
jgi:phytoene synthase